MGGCEDLEMGRSHLKNTTPLIVCIMNIINIGSLTTRSALQFMEMREGG